VCAKEAGRGRYANEMGEGEVRLECCLIMIEMKRRELNGRGGSR
jgi:hypothetical protein